MATFQQDAFSMLSNDASRADVPTARLNANARPIKFGIPSRYRAILTDRHIFRNSFFLAHSWWHGHALVATGAIGREELNFL